MVCLTVDDQVARLNWPDEQVRHPDPVVNEIRWQAQAIVVQQLSKHIELRVPDASHACHVTLHFPLFRSLQCLLPKYAPPPDQPRCLCSSKSCHLKRGSARPLLPLLPPEPVSSQPAGPARHGQRLSDHKERDMALPGHYQVGTRQPGLGL